MKMVRNGGKALQRRELMHMRSIGMCLRVSVINPTVVNCRLNGLNQLMAGYYHLQ